MPTKKRKNIPDYTRLDEIVQFTWLDWCGDETADPNKIKAEIQASYTTNTPPGITPRKVEVVSVDMPGEDDLIVVKVKLSVKDYIHNCLEYGMKQYDILGQVHRYAGEEMANLATKYIKDPKIEFRIAVFYKNDDDNWSSDRWPDKP